MRKRLIVDAFEKAKTDIHSDIPSHLSTHIADILLESYKFSVNERTLRNYYKEAKESSSEDIRISKKNEYYLSKYLGYDGYADFLAKNGYIKQKKGLVKNVFRIGGLMVVLALGYFIYDQSKEDCMIWTNNDHFEKVKCEKKGEISSVRLDRFNLEHFKRVDPDCNYQFFKVDGSPDLWYGKDVNGKLEYFTHHGLHPITNKTLKPITEYMIKKYVCDSIY